MIKNIVFDIGNVLVRFQPDEAMREIGIEENKIAALEEDTAKFATDFTKLQEILNEKTKLEEELQIKYERWEYLNNLAEEIANWNN